RRGVVENVHFEVLANRVVVFLLVEIRFAAHQLRPSGQIASLAGVYHRLVGGARVVKPCETLKRTAPGIVNLWKLGVLWRLSSVRVGHVQGGFPSRQADQALDQAATDREPEAGAVGRIRRLGGQGGEAGLGRLEIIAGKRRFGAPEAGLAQVLESGVFG